MASLSAQFYDDEDTPHPKRIAADYISVSLRHPPSLTTLQY